MSSTGSKFNLNLAFKKIAHSFFAYFNIKHKQLELK